MAYLQKGRWCVWNPDGRVRDGGGIHYPLARLIYEKAHGVILPKSVIVHHVNEDPLDDRIENLEAVTRKEHPSRHCRSIRDGERLCGMCDTWKPLSDFHKGQKRCKLCQRDADAAWRKAHPEKRDEYNRRRRERYAMFAAAGSAEQPPEPTAGGIGMADEQKVTERTERVNEPVRDPSPGGTQPNPPERTPGTEPSAPATTPATPATDPSGPR